MKVNITRTKHLFLHGDKKPVIESQSWRCPDRGDDGKPTPRAAEFNGQVGRLNVARRDFVIKSLQAFEAINGKLTKARRAKLLVQLHEIAAAAAVEAWQAGASAEQILQSHTRRGAKKTKADSIDQTNGMVAELADTGMDYADAFVEVANEFNLEVSAVRSRWHRREK